MKESFKATEDGPRKGLDSENGTSARGLPFIDLAQKSMSRYHTFTVATTVRHHVDRLKGSRFVALAGSGLYGVLERFLKITGEKF